MEHTIIKTWKEFEELKGYLNVYNSPYLVVDTETDSVIEKKAKLYGIALCMDDHEAFYIPIRDKYTKVMWSDEQESVIAAFVLDLCSKKKVIGHNIIYDALVLESNWHFDITPFIYSDTILQKHILDEERPFGLKEVASQYLGSWATKAQDALYDNIVLNGGSTTKDNLQMFKADTDVLGEYSCWDVLLTMKLFNIFEPRIIKEDLYNLFYIDEIMPLYKEVTIPMKQKGFPIDVEYFTTLNEEISIVINDLEKQVRNKIEPLVSVYVKQKLDDNYPVKRKGLFPKYYANAIGCLLPIDKNGKVTLSQKEIDKHITKDIPEHKEFMQWLKGEENNLQAKAIVTAQMAWWKQNNPEDDNVFNLKSNNDLKYLFFSLLRETPLSETDSGQPQVDDDFLESLKHKHEFVSLLVDYKKLMKLKSTYIEGVLDRHIDGVIYSDLLQFGTTSGRYASRNPNLQNLPATKEDDSGLSPIVIKYVNTIRQGFIAPKGYKLIDADQSALEPRCFASVSGDENLQKIFLNNEDMYSSIAIRSFKVQGCSPFKKDDNYLGKLKPDLRKQIKTYALAVAYGAGAGRIANLLNIEKHEAEKLINDYLEAYPKLKEYIDNCHWNVKSKGFIKTRFGRIRHLPRVKSLYDEHGIKLLQWKYVNQRNLDAQKYEFKNGLNNSTNFPIQGLAAHIMNRSAININREFKKNNVDGYVALQVHDQLICIVNQNHLDVASSIVQHQMENSVKIEIPLIAEPKIASNLKDSH